MKAIFPAFLLAACIFLGFSVSYAADDNEASAPGKESTAPIDAADMCYEKTPLNKLGRGLTNVGTFVLEVPASIFRVSDEKGAVVGVPIGFVQGICTAGFRLLTGLYDTLTFPIPSYRKVLMEPEYAYDSLRLAFDEYDANFGKK